MLTSVVAASILQWFTLVNTVEALAPSVQV